MKNKFLRLVLLLMLLGQVVPAFSQFVYDITKADVSIGAPSSDADWNKTYNIGLSGEISVAATKATVSEKNTCNNKAAGKQTVMTLSSSDSQWLDIYLPSTSSATIAAVMFNAAGNSTGSWSHQFYSSTSTPFDETKATMLPTFTLPGYDKACVDQKFEMPEDVKSIRIYRRVKTTANSDGTYSLGSGTNTGCGQTFGLFSFYVWLNKGPQMLTYNVFGTDAVIDHTAGSVTVTVPYATDLSVAQTPTITLSDGASYDATSPYNATSAITFSTTPNPQYILTDGENKKTYTVTVAKVPASIENQLKTFSVVIDGQATAGVIDQTAKTITLELPYSYAAGQANAAAKASILSEFTISDLATCDKTTGTSLDFLSSDNISNFITITSESGVANPYTVILTYKPAETGNLIERFKLLGANETVEITSDTIFVTVPATAALTSLVPNTIDISLLATISPAVSVAQDFSGIVDYTVTSESGVSKTYHVKTILDGVSPTLVSSIPKNDSVGVSLAGLITLEFDEKVLLGTGAITLTDGTTPITLTPNTISTDGSAQVIIPFSGLTQLTQYTLNLSDNSFTDLYGNSIAATSISFTTADGTLHTLPYASYMDGAAFAQPAFIAGGSYDTEIDTKATTTTQNGAYKLAAGESLVLTADQAGQVLVSFYALGGNRSYSISDGTNTLSGSFSNYDNNGDILTLDVNSSTATTITISNTGTGDIYVPYIYVSEVGGIAKTEQEQWCN